jgi:hypothetical protein
VTELSAEAQQAIRGARCSTRLAGLGSRTIRELTAAKLVSPAPASETRERVLVIVTRKGAKVGRELAVRAEAENLAARCGCRRWDVHEAVARARLEIRAVRRGEPERLSPEDMAAQVKISEEIVAGLIAEEQGGQISS